MKSKLNGVLLVALALTAGMLGAGIVNHYEDHSTTSHQGLEKKYSPFQAVNYSGPLSAPTDFVIPAEASVPTVVHVTTTYPKQSGFNNQFMDPFNFFWGQPNQREMPQQQSTGSGVIISDDGYIVTNNHVVENGEEVNVTLDNKESYKAKVIGLDPSTDLALLKVEAQNLPYAAWGNSDQVKVGEWVLAVGNPFNLTSTVTAGIISAKARNIHILPNQKFPIESFIQTDAAVNPGNSGGALVNTRGELIGINAAIASNTGSYSGYSFAIPVNIVKKVVNDLMEYGTVQRGFIGVSIRDVDAQFAKEKELKSLQGVYINGLTEEGAAASAGIKEGDVITSINGIPIKTSPELQEQVGRYRPGDKIDVTVMRNGNEKYMGLLFATRMETPKS
ncbi:MAG: trypsin-like peptidase domain-containing protein [Bacteroidetes bacterium]|nr:trypsin-like peptidase domain-containing protein [Bacteroidota bacterium]